MIELICLGIESTAHTFGIGVVDEKGKVLANEKSSLSKNETGFIPRELVEHHSENSRKVIEAALQKANVSIKEIDLVSFSQGPGIGQALRVGAATARTLSLLHGIPFIGVNHSISHIEIGKKMEKTLDPISCYASGANSQIIGFESGYYRVHGETLDMGLGNLLDSFGREIGLGFPAGPKLDEMYLKGKKLIELPYNVKGMDLIFSGLLTSCSKKIGKESNEDLAYSLIQTSFSMIVEVTERALAHTGKNEVLLVGGVGASKILQGMLKEMCNERGAKFFVPERQFLVDNGAMIAWTGILSFKSGNRMKISESIVKPKQRADAVKVTWKERN